MGGYELVIYISLCITNGYCTKCSGTLPGTQIVFHIDIDNRCAPPPPILLLTLLLPPRTLYVTSN